MNMDIIKDIIDKTLFLAKTLDDFDFLLSEGIIEQSQIIAYRSSKKISEKFPNVYVHELRENVRNMSTSKFFRQDLFADHLFATVINKKNIWIYRSYEWGDDLKHYGKNIYTISFNLYLLLNNKVSQFDFLSNLNNEHTKKYLLKCKKIFKTNTYLKDSSSYHKLQKKYKDFVISNHSSDGGEGIFKISNINDYIYAIENIEFPIIRINKYINGCIPLNQIAIALDNDTIIKYQPSVQIIKEKNTHLYFYGSSFRVLDFIKDEKVIKDMTILTHNIGLSVAKLGYRGMFGCDYLYCPNEEKMKILFIEINPRYQASAFLLANCKQKNINLNPHILHMLSFHKIDKKMYKQYGIKDLDIVFINKKTKQKLDSNFHSFIQLKYSKNKETLKQFKTFEVRNPKENMAIENDAPCTYILAKGKESFFSDCSTMSVDNDLEPYF